MRELLKNDVTKDKVDFERYYIQWYSVKREEWYDINENIWLKSYFDFENNKEAFDKLDECWQRYGVYGILDKDFAMKYLKDLRESVKNNSNDLGISSHNSKENIGGFRLCKCHYKIKAKVLDI